MKNLKSQKKPTIKQIKCFQNLQQGMSKRQAMLKAGYSVSSANQGARPLRKQGMKILMESFDGELINAGLTVEFVAGKVKEWITAKKPIFGKGGTILQEIPDYQTQLSGFNCWKDGMGLNQKEGQKKSRQITLTEFVMDGEKELAENNPIN